MRLAFLLILLANLAFFAWAHLRPDEQEEGREPQRLEQQLHPEKIEVTVQLPPPPEACRRIEGLPLADADRLRQALEGAGLRARVQANEEKPGYWVYIPVFAAQAAAEKKAGELRALGVNDFHVVQEGGGFAVSLGLFAEEGAAKDFLQQLGKKGVKSARLDVKTKAPATGGLEVRGAADALASRLPELAGPAAAAAVDCP
jgi:hypothetical protein